MVFFVVLSSLFLFFISLKSSALSGVKYLLLDWFYIIYRSHFVFLIQVSIYMTKPFVFPMLCHELQMPVFTHLSYASLLTHCSVPTGWAISKNSIMPSRGL